LGDDVWLDWRESKPFLNLPGIMKAIIRTTLMGRNTPGKVIMNTISTMPLVLNINAPVLLD
jgi:hypothetical protein